MLIIIGTATAVSVQDGDKFYVAATALPPGPEEEKAIARSEAIVLFTMPEEPCEHCGYDGDWHATHWVSCPNYRRGA